MIETQATKFAALWADNAIRRIDTIATIEELDLWILAERYNLADVERASAAAWDKLKTRLHARDAEIRERIRQGVG